MHSTDSSYQWVSSLEPTNPLLKRASRLIKRSVIARLTQGQFDALCGLVNKIGPSAFYKSPIRSYLNHSSYYSAADYFLLFEETKDVEVWDEFEILMEQFIAATPK